MKLFRLIVVAITIGIGLPQSTQCSYEHAYQMFQICGKPVMQKLLPFIEKIALVAIPALVFNKIITYIGSVGKMYKPGAITETFDSIAGSESIKEEIADIVDYLKNPSKYQNIGTKAPRGLLMYGPPGTGKTSLARALAGQAGCSFIAITGSELNGSNTLIPNRGPLRAKKLFKQARSCAPCIIFIDEIDAADSEVQRQLLTEMDGFETYKEHVIVIGSTNHLESIQRLTPALLRAGRFDRVVKVDLPNLIDRKSILAFYAGKVKMDFVVDLDIIAQMTAGFSGAELANLINEASIIALKANKQQIDQADLEDAFDKITAGKTEKNTQRTQEERRIVAYHEAGHVLITILLGNICTPLFKVTIAQHEHSEGCTTTVPTANTITNKDQIMAMIQVKYGGRAAEMLVFNKPTTGSSGDIEKAANLARAMLYTYGMSDVMGPVVFHYPSSKTLYKIEQETSKILLDAYNAAYTMLSENRDKLDCIANALLKKETLSAKEVYALLGMNQPTKNI